MGGIRLCTDVCPSPPPVASIQNKINFPFHQPGLLTGLWVVSSQTLRVVTPTQQKGLRSRHSSSNVLRTPALCQLPEPQRSLFPLRALRQKYLPLRASEGQGSKIHHQKHVYPAGHWWPAILCQNLMIHSITHQNFSRWKTWWKNHLKWEDPNTGCEPLLTHLNITLLQAQG